MIFHLYVTHVKSAVQISVIVGDHNAGTLVMPKQAWKLLNPMLNWGNTFFEEEEASIVVHQKKDFE